MNKHKLIKSMYLEVIGIIGVFPRVAVDCIYTHNHKRVIDTLFYTPEGDSLKVTSFYLNMDDPLDSFMAFAVLTEVFQDISPERMAEWILRSM